MKSVLIPIDFSKTSDKALDYAIRFFGNDDCTFILFHSFIPFESGFYSVEKSEEEAKQTEVELTRKLRKKIQKFNSDKSFVHFKIVILRGVVERNILKYSTKANVDMIIMGTTGVSGLKEKLIGSVSANVMTKALCPVIGIPEKYIPRPIKRIAFCSNYQLEDIGVLKYLNGIAKKFNSKIEIWHFNKKNALNDHVSQDYKSIVEKVFGKNKMEFHFSSSDDVNRSLDKLSRNKNLDLVAMITHPRKGFFKNLLDKSLTKQVVYHTRLPLLTFKNNPLD